MPPPTATVTIERAKRWAEADPNPTTSAYVASLVERAEQGAAEGDDNKHDDDQGNKAAASSRAELVRLFPPNDANGRIGFGTAGLRGPMQPGPLGMNDLVVVQTTQGLARYCQEYEASQNRVRRDDEDEGSGNKRRSRLRAVVGYDHRCNAELNLSSRNFALMTKLVFLEAGMDCILLDCGGVGSGGIDGGTSYVHTPLVAYATTALNAAVGVMITASHNPKCDDGYKVYWTDGCQIRPPLDVGIAASIVREENLVPWTDYGRILERRRTEQQLGGANHDACLGLGDPTTTKEMADSYFDTIHNSSGLVTGQARLLNESGGWRPPGIVYTAMHGVGHPWAQRALQVFNLRPFHSVPAQQSPDASFPTVPFPNPEEKGALDRAMAFAEQEGCDIVMANDPDADRLAVAERCRASGTWTVLTGDQIGTMLGHWLWQNVGKGGSKPVAMCASTVSSTMLSTIAKAEGFHFEDTLTGFKWIGSRCVSLQSEGYRPLFGYEEAIGFAFPDVVPDKDGITALAVMTELAYSVYHRGKCLKRHMQDLYAQYGEFVCNNGYYFCHDPVVVQLILSGMRNGGKYMESVCGYEIESIRDLGDPGYDSLAPDHRPTLPTSKSSPMMTLRFKNGCVAQFRASGTEPKFKYYIEMRGEPGVSRQKVTAELEKMSAIILQELLKPEENGLVTPSKL